MAVAGYLSANAQVITGAKAKLSNYLIDEFAFDDVKFWVKDTPYKESNYNDCDVFIFHLNNIQGVAGNELMSYLGKGQFSELERALAFDKTIFFIDSAYTYYEYEHHTINDYNDWKKKYGKVWVKKVEPEDIWDLTAHLWHDVAGIRSDKKLLLLLNK